MIYKVFNFVFEIVIRIFHCPGSQASDTIFLGLPFHLISQSVYYKHTPHSSNQKYSFSRVYDSSRKKVWSNLPLVLLWEFHSNLIHCEAAKTAQSFFL